MTSSNNNDNVNFNSLDENHIICLDHLTPEKCIDYLQHEIQQQREDFRQLQKKWDEHDLKITEKEKIAHKSWSIFIWNLILVILII